jgi:hypothetical protein
LGTGTKLLPLPSSRDGQFPRGGQNQREDLSINRPWNGRSPFLDKLFASDVCKTKYLASIKKLNTSVIQPDELKKEVAELVEVLRDPVRKESKERLASFNKAASGESILL